MKLTPKKVKSTWPTPKFCVRTQRNLYSTGLRLGFALGKTQLLGFSRVKREKFASPNAKDTNMLVFFALGNANVWRWGSKPTPVPNANGFASQWNIGLRAYFLFYVKKRVKTFVKKCQKNILPLNFIDATK